MRHREPARHDLAARDIHHHAAIVPMVAPAFVDIRGAHGGDVGGRAVGVQREAIQVAAIFRREARDERRTPQRAEAMRGAGLGEAGEERIYEDGRAIRAQRDVVAVHVARGVGELRHVEAIKAHARSRCRRALPRWQRVFKTPELVERGKPKRLRIG